MPAANTGPHTHEGTSEESRSRQASIDLKWAISGGVFSALVLGTVVATVGNVGSFEGLKLLQSVLPTIRFFAATVIGAAATVLALMLTLLGITFSSDWDFKSVHYDRIKVISVMGTVAIVAATLLLLSLGIPLEEAEKLRRWYNVLYYVFTGGAAVLGGMLVSMVLMLASTISGLVAIGHPEGDSELVEGEV